MEPSILAEFSMPSRFSVFDTPIPDLKLIQRQQMGDSRGFLSRIFCAEELEVAGWCTPIAQINQTLTKTRGTVRGLHFQRSPNAEMKLVTCLRGAVWDVAVDLRAGSSTFLHWHAVELSTNNSFALLIPEGFAHGFQALCDDCELLYFHSNFYKPEAEAGINPKEPMLSIDWPLAITELSAKDASFPELEHHFKGVLL